MRVDSTTLASGQAQAAMQARLPRSIVLINGVSNELNDPRALIDKARRVLLAVTPTAAGQTHAAKKVFGLLYAASLRAQAIRHWSVDPTYSPLEDYSEIQSLAAANLGPIRNAQHIVTKVRQGIDESVKIYSATGK